VAIIFAVPAVLFVLPAFAGHPAIVGDNLLQNYPLRVLSGRQIASGHWPVWNPYADSGTPLLGGLNAGSLYPGTVLFAFLPGLVAWIANLLLVYWCAGIGLFVLARWLGAGPLGAGLAGATYAFSGAMIGQLVHIAVIQGQAWLPWMVLSQLVLARALLSLRADARARDVVRRAAPGALGLAATIGMICLTGEPRSITDAEMVVVIVLLCELVVHGGTAIATVRGRVAYVVASGIGVAWGIALAAVQLLPGWAFISISERSKISYSFFGGGSVGWRWLSLLLSQGLLGDNGILGTPRFFGSYNLPEVTGYVGLLAVTAVFAFSAQLFGRRSAAPRRRLFVFLAIAVVGIVLTLGNTTPFGPVLHAIPLFGQTRLQSRNLAIVDLGATVLLAWWVDALARGRRDEASLTGRRAFVTLAPLTVTVLLCATAIVSPGAVTEVLLASPNTSQVASGIRLAVGVSLVLAVAYLVVLTAMRGRATTMVRALLVIAIVDLVGFNVFYETGLVTGLKSSFPDTPSARALLGTSGRTALVDPPLGAYHETAPLGLGNLNVFTRLASVQGYGSLIAERYNDVTGTKLLSTLDGCSLARGAFVPLRLASMAVATDALVVTPKMPPAPHVCGPPGAKVVSRRYFGRVVQVIAVRFVPADALSAATEPRVELLDSHGDVVHAPVVLHVARNITAQFPTRPLAAGVVLVDPDGVRLGSTVLLRVGGQPSMLDTSIQVGLDSSTWRLTDVVGQMSFFRADAVQPAVWLLGAPRGAVAHVVSADESGAATVAVDASSAATLVRSETWLPGWGAQVSRPNGTDAHAVTVHPDGLVQAVSLPAGAWLVEFTYHAPHFRSGLLVSSIALLALLVLAAWVARTRRRPREGHPLGARREPR
jgi:hypothetical protein